MSQRDLLKDSLARHRARIKAEKRKRDALERGTGVKHLGNFFQIYGRGRNRTQSVKVESASNQQSGSEMIPSDVSPGVKNIFHSVELEQDVIEASQFKKQKKEADGESQSKTQSDALDSKIDTDLIASIGN